jgi:hypothetical protein
LDACCLNRLTDDQSQPRIAEEADAVEQILRLLRAKTIEWLSSTALKAETNNNPDAERRYEVEVLLSLATNTIRWTAKSSSGQWNSKPWVTAPSMRCTWPAPKPALQKFCSRPMIDSSRGLRALLAHRAFGF